MRRITAFPPKPGPLFNTKPVLFIDDYQAQIAELYIILDKGMRSYENVQRFIEKGTVYFLPE